MDISLLLFLQDLDKSTGGILRTIAEYISELGASTFTVVILIILYLSIDKKLGIRIMLVYSVGGLLNQTLKNAFTVNRPWVKNPQLVSTPKGYESATGYSFPSGHSQTAVASYGNFAYYVGRKRKFLFWTSIIIMFLVPISRLILGVHTPQDVIGGMLTGLFGMVIWLKLEDWIVAKKGRDFIALGVSVVIIAAHLLYVSLKYYEVVVAADGSLLVDPVAMVVDCYAVAGVALAAIGGLIFEKHIVDFDVSGPVWVRIIRSVVGIAIFYALYKGIGSLECIHIWAVSFIKMAVSFFFVVAIWPWFAGWYEKKLFRIGV